MGRETRAYVEEVGPQSVDVAIAAIARRQHGVISARQLYALGLTKDGIWQRVRAGHLHRCIGACTRSGTSR